MVNVKIHAFFSHNCTIYIWRRGSIYLYIFFNIFLSRDCSKWFLSSFIFALNCFLGFFFVSVCFMLVYTIGVTISWEVGTQSKALLKPFSKVSLSCATGSSAFPFSKIINWVPKLRLVRSFNLKMDAVGFKIRLKTFFRFRASLVSPHSRYAVLKCHRRVPSSKVITATSEHRHGKVCK